MRVRLIGVISLLVCAYAVRMLYNLVHSPPPHQPTTAELAIALLAVVTGLGGMMIARVGDELVSNSDDQGRGKRG